MRTLFAALIAAGLAASFAIAQTPPSLLFDIQPGPNGSSPDRFIQNGASIAIRATDPLGTGLWLSDGTPSGTQRFATDHGYRMHALGDGFAIVEFTTIRFVDRNGVSTVVFQSTATLDAERIVVIGDRMFFAAYEVSGHDVWTTDGTVAGTRPAGLGVGAFNFAPRILGRIGGQCAFLARPSGNFEFFTTDGTLAGTRAWPGLATTNWDGQLAAGEDSFWVLADESIWKGDPRGNTLQFVVSAPNEGPQPLGVVGTKLVFARTDAAHGREPWVTDGTAAGTSLLVDIYPGVLGSGPMFGATSGNRVVFSATGGVWVSDGTAAGTLLAMATNNLTLVNGSAWFERGNGHVLAFTTLARRSLWEVDLVGTTAQDLGVEFLPAAGSAGRLIGAKYDASSGVEPWVWAPGALAIRVGTPCGAGTDAAELRASVPRLGTPFQFDGTAPSTAQLGVLVVGAVPPRAVRIGNGCTLQVDPSTMSVLTALPAIPHWSVGLQLPGIPVLQGLTIAAQALYGPSPLPLGVEASNGLHLTFG